MYLSSNARNFLGDVFHRVLSNAYRTVPVLSHHRRGEKKSSYVFYVFSQKNVTFHLMVKKRRGKKRNPNQKHTKRMNYSKWDKFAAEIDDDDEDDQPRGARVTKLDQPSRVSVSFSLEIRVPVWGRQD